MLASALQAEIAKIPLGWTLAYVANDKCKKTFGMNIFTYNAKSIDLFASIQFGFPKSKEDYYESLNEESFGDEVTDRFQDLLMYNIGIKKNVFGGLAPYIGIGYASLTGYAEKYDPEHILASDGYYVVRDEDADESGVNVNPGLMWHYKSLAVELGYHSFVNGVAFGLGLNF